LASVPYVIKCNVADMGLLCSRYVGALSPSMTMFEVPVVRAGHKSANFSALNLVR
jgi:hypothetical protein